MKKLFIFFAFAVVFCFFVSGCGLKPKTETPFIEPEKESLSTSSLKIFEDNVFGIQASYRAGMIPSVKEEVGLADGGVPAGKKRGIYFSEDNYGQPKPFAVAFTSDYQFPPTAGCCFSYNGEPVDISLSIEELNETLRFPHLDNIRKIKIGGVDAIRFTGVNGDESGTWLAEYALMPFSAAGFSNMLFFGPTIHAVNSEDPDFVEKVNEMKRGETEISTSTQVSMEEFDEMLKGIVFAR
jgi:hypothetical protein